MAPLIQIWTCASFHTAFRCGGWAHIRSAEGLVTGSAGGERRTTGPRTSLLGLAAAVSALPASAGCPPVEVRTTDADLAAFAGLLDAQAQAGPREPPAEEQDLWTAILTATAGRRVRLLHCPLGPGTPSGFTMAWAEFARDKAKAGGAFTAPIPKSNLARVPGLKTG